MHSLVHFNGNDPENQFKAGCLGGGMAVGAVRLGRRSRPSVIVREDSEGSSTMDNTSDGSAAPSPVFTDDAVPAAGGSAFFEHLKSVNASLLAALKVERCRTQYLEQELERLSLDIVSDTERTASLGARNASRPASVPLRHALGRLSATSSNTTMRRSLSSKLSRRGPKRSRVIIHPHGAPLKLGSLVAADPSSPFTQLQLPVTKERTGQPALSSAASEPAVVTAATDALCFPEPACSPPPRFARSRWPLAHNTAKHTTATATMLGESGSHPRLSSGLVAKSRSLLAEELSRLQEHMTALLTQSNEDTDGTTAYADSLRSLTRRLGWLRCDVAALMAQGSQLEGATEGIGKGDVAEEPLAPPDLPSLYELAASSEEFACSLRGELAAASRAQSEAKYAARLAATAGLQISPVAKDGNCLFACIQRWLSLHADAPVSDADLEAAAMSSGGTRAAERALEAFLCSTADEVRALTVRTMRERISVMDSDDDLRTTIEDSVRAAVQPSATDGTSVALRAALDALTGASKSDGGGPADASTWLETYLDVMSRPGTYGERVELQALATLIRAPIHVYYLLPSNETAAEDADARAADGAISEGGDAARRTDFEAAEEVIAPIGVPSVYSPPIRLLHSVSGCHFDLLLPVAK